MHEETSNAGSPGHESQYDWVSCKLHYQGRNEHLTHVVMIGLLCLVLLLLGYTHGKYLIDEPVELLVIWVNNYRTAYEFGTNTHEIT